MQYISQFALLRLFMCYLVQGDNQICIYLHCIYVYIHGEINRSRQEALGAPRDFNNALCLCTHLHACELTKCSSTSGLTL